MKTTFKTKLFAGFAFILLLMTFIVIICISRQSRLNDRLNYIVDISSEKINLGHDIIHTIIDINRKKNNILLSSSQEEIDRYVDVMDKLSTDLDIFLKKLYGLADDNERARLDDFKIWCKKYSEINHRVVALSRAGSIKEARKLSQERGRDLLTKAEGVISDLDNKYHKDLEVDKLESDKEYLSARDLVIFILIIALIAGILVAMYIVRNVITRTQYMAGKAGEIAAGRLFREEEERNIDELSPISLSLKEISRSFENITKQAQEIARGNFLTNIELRSEEDELGIAIQKMSQSLIEAKEENQKQAWLRTGQNELNEKMRGEQNILDLSRNIVTYLAKYLAAQIGALYIAEGNNHDHNELKLCGSYAFHKRKDLNAVIKVGEGLAGQAAFEKEMISVANIPEDYVRINSAIGDALPRNVLVAPFLFDGEMKGVIEIGSFKEFSDNHMEFINMVGESIAIAIHSAQSRAKVQALLEESRRMAEELQAQQEELQAANEELEEQTQSLKESEEELKEQQVELQSTNEELQAKTDSLESQKSDIKRKNDELESSRKDLEQKAKDLAMASKYKSEFLANMSHELRTPLNSLLILSQGLYENKAGNLTDRQTESVKIIHNSGEDLLDLINEILDLSKIEAGRIDIDIKKVPPRDLAEGIRANFKHMVDDKGLAFKVIIDQNAPEAIFTDRKRAEQIIKNLMSNAIKFTEQGAITVEIKRPDKKMAISGTELNPQKAVAISITDTGIGIPPEKQRIIFEAFQQAEGGTARKYGGTGLGLSISKELTNLLGGEIQLISDPGKGSTFTLYLPVERSKIGTLEADREFPHRQSSETLFGSHLSTTTKADRPDLKAIPDDRNSLKEDDKTILIIEDDQNFATVLMDQCHQRGFKCLISADGEGGLELAAKHQPKAVILDILLPGMDGWRVIEALKDNSATRHIPVHIMSIEEETIYAYKKGAIGFLTKPVEMERLEEVFTKIEKIIEKDIKNLLVVEDNRILRERIVALIGNSDVQTTEVSNGPEAIEAIKSEKYDCMVLDLGLPGMSGFQVLQTLEKDKNVVIPPVIVYTGRELTREEDEKLRNYAESIIIKGVKSEERLLDETALFLHRVVANLPEKKKTMITKLYDKDMALKDKKILLVDDDMRNAFALSKVLQERGMKALKAEDGQKALNILAGEPDIDLILMDIMMPVMDGYETTRKIREQQKFWDLPIIALTAKAMKEDREKCLAAGANDYLPKPINVDRLLSMMRIWLYR